MLFQFESTVQCSDEDNGRMDYKLILFWNIFYSLMIVTAVLGNCAVLWIVIRKKPFNHSLNLAEDYQNSVAKIHNC